MKRYEIFLLDADDTLFDFTACCKNALKNALRECGFSYREGYHLQYLKINNELWRALERKEITHGELFSLRFQEFLTAVGEGVEKASLLNEKYVAALADECVILKGATEFLTKLKELGKIYIITNGTASVQRGRFKKFALENYAEKIFVSEEMGVYKPAKEYFDRVAQSIPDFDKERALIIGDSLTSDISLANAAEVDCVWFNPLEKPLAKGAKPTYIAKNYDEILKIIRERI